MPLAACSIAYDCGGYLKIFVFFDIPCACGRKWRPTGSTKLTISCGKFLTACRGPCGAFDGRTKKSAIVLTVHCVFVYRAKMKGFPPWPGRVSIPYFYESIYDDDLTFSISEPAVAVKWFFGVFDIFLSTRAPYDSCSIFILLVRLTQIFVMLVSDLNFSLAKCVNISILCTHYPILTYDIYFVNYFMLYSHQCA